LNGKGNPLRRIENMSECSLEVSRIFCIGRNYTEHVRELANVVPQKPVVFIKPATCLVAPGGEIHFPQHGSELHHEAEIVVKVGRQGRAVTEEEALTFVSAVTIGLDLTLRDVQSDLKKKGLPWEIAKAFEQSAPIGDFVSYDGSLDLKNIPFGCKVNGKERQKGNSGEMIFSIPRLLVELSDIWVLRPGDLIYTGTPSGVGPLEIGDTIEVESDAIGSFSWSIVE
jgi:2-keto-4-pentenoate hydratase/2-oxohepta-3-ene-1,7-dioic acid hydratase in catechol pathway